MIVLVNQAMEEQYRRFFGKMTDSANPKHYRGKKVTPIDLIEEYGLNFNCGNVIKYIARHKEKGGRIDLVKALWYLLRELGMSKRRIEQLTDQMSDIPNGK